MVTKCNSRALHALAAGNINSDGRMNLPTILPLLSAVVIFIKKFYSEDFLETCIYICSVLGVVWIEL
jgi:hypothetical protein